MNKEYYETLLLNMISPLKRFYSRDQAHLYIGYTGTHYEDHTIPIEACLRVLWGLVPFWAGGGNSMEFEIIYRKGIRSGTDPDHNEFWGHCRDYDQKFVEMAALSYALLFVPDKVWTPLSENEKENLVQWLNEINLYKCSDSNWQYFCILTNLALKSVGREYSKELFQQGIEKIESYYIGGGWYRDGEKGAIDYYCAFAFHFYGLIYSMFMWEEDRERCVRFRERAREFGRDFVYWFSEEGCAVPYGRSLTYRFAQAAFFSMCVLAGVEVFPLSVMKGIICRHLDYWLRMPIFDLHNILTIGYGYPDLIMSESYNSPGSPYWAMKAFAFLALPKEHVFWQIEAEELPRMESVKCLRYAEVLIQRSNDHVVLFAPGIQNEQQQPNYAEKYSKFAYSCKFGFSVSRSQRNLEEAAPDSMLAFQVFDHIFVKTKIECFELKSDRLIIKWSPIEGIHVITEIEVRENSHIRCHEIESIFDCKAYDCGFAVPATDGNSIRINKSEGTAEARCNTSLCRVETLSDNGEGIIIEASPNTNLLCTKTVIPGICYSIKKGMNRIKTIISCQ